MMTVSELIARLEEIVDAGGEDLEVRLMTQYEWPFENACDGVTTAKEMHEDGEAFDPMGDEDDAVYILEGQQLGYGTKTAWRTC